MTWHEKHGLAVHLGDWFDRNGPAVPNYILRYFLGTPGTAPFGGRHFETFVGMGDPDRFEATDILAAAALSVTIPSGSALRVLRDDADEFNAVLKRLPRIELWKAERSIFEPDGDALKLFHLLDGLDGIGTTKATKLMAAKRPYLVPVQDAYIEEELMEPGGKFWLPIYDQLADPSLRDFIGGLTAGAPQSVSLLRRIDVAVWMHVNDRKVAERTARKAKRS